MFCEVVAGLRGLFAVGKLQEEILVGFPGQNERRTRSCELPESPETHVNVGDLIQGIVANVAVGIFIEHRLVGLAGFVDASSGARRKGRG